MLKLSKFNTKLGEMLAVASEHHLYLLEFIDYKHLNLATKQLKNFAKSDIEEGKCEPLDLAEKEITKYLNGDIKNFTVPVMLIGTDFQKKVWNGLQKIPYGVTASYKELAVSIGKPNSYRAVASSNGANKLVIVIPCHRVIASSGDMGGYSCGLERKKHLLDLESSR